MKKIRRIASLLVVVLLFSTVLSACGSKSTSSKGVAELAVCLASEPDTIDPALNSAVDGGTLINHAFEGLMRLDKDGVPQPAQAESYKVSDDGLTYTFTLRDGIKWSDDTPVTANDFVYSWNRAIQPETAADYEYMFDVVKGYEDKALDVVAQDDKTLVVTLNSVTPYFLELCAFPAYLPVKQSVVEASPDAWATEPATYIGNGPYVLKEWVHNSYMLLEKNEKYWDVKSLNPQTIKFVLMADDNAILSAYEAGEILFADSMPNAEIQAWKEKPEFHLQGQIGTYYVSFNVKKAPLDNKLVRQALILAVDRQYIADQIGQAGQVPAGAFVPIGLTDSDPAKEFRAVGGDYYDPMDYAGNVEKAKQLLAEAGYPNGEGLPSIEYLYNEGTGHQQIGEALQDMWSKIGVKVELVSQEWNTFLNTRKNGEYFIARNGWLGDYNDPISFLDMWITGGGNNDAQWSNTEYDSLIKSVKSSSDAAERMKLMHQAEDIIFEDSMLCPLYYYVDIYLQNAKLENVYSSPLGFKNFMHATVAE